MNLMRNLLGLMISSIMLPICISCFTFVSNFEFDYKSINDEIAINQLRETLLIAYDMEVHNDELNFIYKNKDFVLSLVNEKLILQPGTQIYLMDIDDVYFYERNNCVYVRYFRGDKEFEKVLCKQNGIHLEQFSSCDVHDDGDDSAES